MKNILVLCLLISTSSLVAQHTIYGKVTNQNSEYLVSATVFILSENLATSTDDKGNFVLENVPSGTHLLQADYVGYQAFANEMLINEDTEQNIVLGGLIFNIDQIEIKANRLNDIDAPFTYLNIEKEDIETTNLGQDLPHLLQYTPSVVVTSDAGNGIGYTGLRVRGSDPTRVNVTINGIPLNDSESQGVFWVNLPDLASSAENIQIQRGLGTSTSGAGAFGATIGVNTHQMFQNPHLSLNTSYGSFNTSKINLNLGTGLMNDAYYINFRYSSINSDGYIDRASSDLASYAFSAGKIHDKGSLRFDLISGREVTYQSWNGTPEAKFLEDDQALQNHYDNNVGVLYHTPADSINLFDSDQKYNYYTYEDQVDDYGQDHLQFHLSQMLDEKLTFNGSLHYTRGKGFFQEFRYKDELANYGIDPIELDSNILVTEADIIRKRWLDNHFYGALLNFNFAMGDQSNLLIGGGVNRYDGDHYGNVVFNEFEEEFDRERLYYLNNGTKNDLNAFAKYENQLSPRFSLFADMQVRSISYDIEGTDNDGLNLDINDNLLFFNPKVGIKYEVTENSNFYASYGIGNREADRNDYVANYNSEKPKHETLNDLEIGFRHTDYKINYEAVVYFMDYKNQLVLTGELNDVGSTLRTNVDNSYRAGIELSANWDITEKLKWSPNLTLSRNKIAQFTEVLYDYDNDEIINNTYDDTHISFSPEIIFGSRIKYEIMNGLDVEWLTKHVGSQFLDNTSNNSRSLDSYLVNDFRCSYQLKNKFIKSIKLNLLINNILNEKYASNGYTYSYVFGDLITENFVYPQAQRNFLLGLSVDF